MLKKLSIFVSAICLLSAFSLSPMENITSSPPTIGEEMIKVFSKNSNTEVLVPLADMFKKYSTEATIKTVKQESPNIIKSVLSFVIDHRKSILQGLGYSCAVGGILYFRYSKYYWTTPEQFDKKLEASKQIIIKELKQQIIANNEAHGTTTLAIQDTGKAILLGYAAMHNTIEDADVILKSATNKALQSELARRKFLQEDQRVFYDYLDEQTDELLLLQLNVANNVQAKKSDLTKKHSVLSQGISTLSLAVDEELIGLEKAVVSQQQRRSSTINALESSSNLEETVAILDKYNLLNGQILEDVEFVIRERKQALNK